MGTDEITAFGASRSLTRALRHSGQKSRLARTSVHLATSPLSCSWLIFSFLLQLSAITPDILGILKNTEILAINQDNVVGKSISPFRWGRNVCASTIIRV